MIEWQDDLFKSLDELSAANQGYDLEKSTAVAEKPLTGGHWITLNGGESSETGEHTGTHVYISGDGRILAGPKELQGRNIKNLKEAPKPEQLQPPRDLKNEGIYRTIKDLPSHDDIVHHLRTHHADYYNGSGRDGGIDDDLINDNAKQIAEHLKELHDNTALHGHAISELKDRRDPESYKFNKEDYDPLMSGPKMRMFNRAVKQRHEDAVEEAERRSKQAKEEEEREKKRAESPYITEEKLMKGKVSDFIGGKLPSEEELEDHFKALKSKKYKGFRGQYLREIELDNLPSYETKPKYTAQNVHSMLKLLDTPEKKAAAVMVANSPQMARYNDAGMEEQSIRAIVNEALIRAREQKYTASDGTKVSISPDTLGDHTYYPSKGRSFQVNGYKVHVITPVGREQTHILTSTKKGKVAEKNFVGHVHLEGLPKDAMDFIKHVTENPNGDKPFVPKEQKRAKPTGKYEPYPEDIGQTDAEHEAAFQKAKADLEAHGAGQVLEMDHGTPLQKARTAVAVATAFRALYHLSGGGAPQINIVLGDANSRGVKTNVVGSKAAAYYSSWSRAMTIDNTMGEDTFWHEYGHYLDDTINRNKDNWTYGSQKEGHAISNIVDELQKTPEYKERQKKLKNSYSEDRKEVFARFFDQWISRQAEKKGYELPSFLGLNNIQNARRIYENYEPETIDRVGEKIKDALKAAGLWKSLMTLLYILSETKLY